MTWTCGRTASSSCPAVSSLPPSTRPSALPSGSWSLAARYSRTKVRPGTASLKRRPNTPRRFPKSTPYSSTTGSSHRRAGSTPSGRTGRKGGRSPRRAGRRPWRTYA
ncbi:MAG: hypothetical protein BJ554DRAFT_1942 [Olpidium bornovanus]|uniref:Uncharacterized protein n=1 Tax=Olpidium bornovanus TaxID=278681 RepID=A0A8H7ZRA5_9FUNG|nr:MAG: hypothetical protein BJ554DRAFT_1942 [Olpidium bornovanus]